MSVQSLLAEGCSPEGALELPGRVSLALKDRGFRRAGVTDLVEAIAHTHGAKRGEPVEDATLLPGARIALSMTHGRQTDAWLSAALKRLPERAEP